MRALSTFLALALSAALQPAMAGAVTLDFEDITSITRIQNRYGDVKFTNNAWGVRVNDEDTDAVCNGSWLYVPLAKDVPNCGALMLGSTASPVTSPSQVSFTITSEFGFVDAVSFAFAIGDTSANASIEILDESGLTLKSAALKGDACEPGVDYAVCFWNSGTLTFGGTARSIVFSAKDQKLMLDDLKLTTASAPPTRLPEPASIALTFSALGVLGWARKRATR